MDRAPQAYLFSPKEAEVWRKKHCPPYHGQERKTKVYLCEIKRQEKIKKARRGRQSKRPAGDRYDTASYRRGIEYGMRKARKAGYNVPHWHPHQLRHSRATELRKLHGVEAAQVTLGHTRADVTQIYAERDQELAERIARQTG